MFDNAKWIMLDKKMSEESILFRKEFILDATVKKAELNICALGLGVTTINQHRITDNLFTTPFTRYDYRIIAQKYDVTPFLKIGKNAIGLHIGNGFYNNNMSIWSDSTQSWRDVPKLIVRLEITFTNNTSKTICSDTTWKATKGPCIYNMMRQGEIFDASKTQNGFDFPGFDDSDWTFAKIAKEPGGKIEFSDIPPIQICETIKPVSFIDGIYDFGKNISGRVKINLSGNKGQKVSIQYDEGLNSDGTLKNDINKFARRDECKLCHKDIYICGGEKEVYAPEFVYHGFRYVKVENAPKDFDIVAEFIHTNVKTIGHFECDNEMLNKIHDASVRSTLSNLWGIPTDCPHREQNGWTGDAHLSAEQSLMNFDMFSFYKKWLNDFKDVQRKSGQLPSIIPTSSWGYNIGSGPAWDSALILIPWYVYQNTGRLELISQMWDNMELYMKYIERMSEDGIVDFGLGDWCSPKETFRCPTAVTDTAYFYFDSCIMGKCSDLLGKDSSVWFEKAEKIKRAWREHFLNDKSLEKYQTFYATAIYQGLLSKEEIPIFAKNLSALVEKNDYHIDCGILGTKYIFSALSENGYINTVYKMVTNPTMPGYAYWINQGMTTLCESWDMHDSLNHHMFSEVDNWLYKYVGGISVDEGNILITPMPVDGIDYVKVSFNDCTVERKKNHVTVTLSKETKVKQNGTELLLSSGIHKFDII